eukprot:1598104-Prymnesium_polylepis.2
MCNGFPLRFCLRASFERSRSLAEVDHRLCSSISWPPKHCMVPSDVCYAQFPVLWPSGGPDIDVTVARALSWVSEPSGRYLAEVASLVRSSTRRLYKHRMVLYDV